MGAVFPVLMRLLYHAKIYLIDQSGRLKCVVAPFMTETRCGSTAKFVMQEDKKPGFSILFAVAKVYEQTCNFSG
jgi:hypothetical protein